MSKRKNPSTPPGALADEARARMLEDIIQCRIRPGEMVQLSDLARRYEMSKTPVREALTLLERDGLVEPIPYKGYRIPPIDEADIEDIFFMRELLEGAAVEAAAGRITEEDLQRLEALEAPDTPVMTLHYDDYARTFHTIIAHASGMQRLARQVVDTYTDVRRLQYAGVGRPRPKVITQEHEEIVKALRARDGELAKKAMVEHIRNIRLRAESS
ncbi:MAG TPA: GntR family transcriptional regulator [Egibacteraceae bacterium]|nr:GntR family transcriptional regulator [Egibacteraceae bacterium]